MGVRQEHVAALHALAVERWEDYLGERSGLPGPRANLELLAAAGDVAPAATLLRWSAADDEYLACVGTAGIGRLVLEGRPALVADLRRRAEDGRWRVREGVALALQRIGDGDPGLLRAVTSDWAAGPPLVQRAAVAGLCEPRLLRAPGTADHALAVLDRVTASLAALVADRRRDPDVRVLRQGLGYCWSVAVAAAPGPGFDALERWAASPDRDVRWVLRENLRKARLLRADADRTAALAVAVT